MKKRHPHGYALAFLCLAACAPKSTPPPPPAPPTPAARWESIPDSSKKLPPFNRDSVLRTWEGTYIGRLDALNANDPTQAMNARVRLEVRRDTTRAGRWLWTTTYQNQRFGKVEKPYALEQPDSLPSHLFWTNEYDAIYLGETYLDGSFYGMYDVGNTRYHTRYRQLGRDTIDFELTTFSGKPTYINRVPETANEDPNLRGMTSEVLDFRLTSVQKVIFVRTPNN